MKYFIGISDIEQAKQHYRILAKQLHPDKGGTASEFQRMQDEYKVLLLSFQQKQKVITTPIKNNPAEAELINELGKLAKVLIKKQVPQDYLRQKMQSTDSPLKKGLLGNIVNLLDSLN